MNSLGTRAVRLSGWGANLQAECVLVEPENEKQVARAVDRVATIARGLGRSYGDAALNRGGRVVQMTRCNRYVAFDESTGVLTCEAGVSLEQILRDMGPRGWFPAVTPGTKFVTVGGCIANDVHGKGHHSQGTFSECVDRLKILLADGETVAASRTENADLFWATFGGMGLLGVVLTATFRLRRIETTYFRRRSVVARDLDAMLVALEENDREFPYSVATLDVFATGARLGRGVLVVGDHARLEELPPHRVTRPLRAGRGTTVTVPFTFPEFVLNRASMRVVNAVIQYTQSRPHALAHYDAFVYPLDGIAHWNRGYGRSGFVQYQFVIPFADGPRRLREILTAIVSSGSLPFLNVLKRFGQEGQGILSFPRAGYTFAIDFPVRQNTASLLKRLDSMVLDAGGRVYLGKDSALDAATFRAMYPKIDAWLEVKAKYDPNGVFASDLARRVGLVVH